MSPPFTHTDEDNSNGHRGQTRTPPVPSAREKVSKKTKNIKLRYTSKYKINICES